MAKTSSKKTTSAPVPTPAPAKQKLRLGIVGIGGIFNAVHAAPLLEHPDVEIVAVCDIVKSKAQKFADAHGIKHVYEKFSDLIARKDIDVVDICTSNKFHSIIAVEALNAGKHVFTEKPDAINGAEAQKMADAAAKSGKVLMAMRNNRFRQASKFAKRFIEDGHMGEIYTGRCGWIRRRGIPGKGGWFTTKELSGGGPLIDLGVHMIDLAIWFMGDPRAVAVTGATYCKFANVDSKSDSVHAQFGEAKSDGIFDVEDLASGFIRFDNGATLQIEFSWASNVEAERTFVELRGTKAGLTLDHDLTIYTEMSGALCNVTPNLPKDKPAHAQHLNHFIDVVQGKAKPINRPEHGVNMIKVLGAIYESARLGREVQL